MKLKSSMSFVVPVVIIFIILSFLVAIFAIQNTQTVKLRYKIPFTSYQFPAEIEPGQPNYLEIDVVYVILISMLIGIAIMTIFVIIAGIGWRYYMLSNRSRERKERRILWDHRERAIALSLMGFHHDATEQFEHIIDKENPHIELYIGLAQAYEREGDHQRAIENYNSILARYPENMRALFGAAQNWEALGNYTDAIKLYNRVLDVDRSSPRALQKVRELLEKSGQYAEAIEAYQRTKAAQASPQAKEIVASLFYRLAVQQIKSGDLESAERTLKESRREYDYYVPTMLILANLYLNTGREREAERLWQATAEQTLSTVIFRRLEDYYYKQEGELEEKLEPIIDLYKSMIDAHDANHLRLALGKLYLKIEKYEDAERLFLEFQSKDTSIPQVHLLLADLYQRTGNVDKALDEYRISAELVDIKIADFKCYHCGAMYEYWADHCSSCGSWGTIEDIFFTKGPQSVLPELKPKPLPQLPSPGEASAEEEEVVSSS
ncbi:tetratricopeptide repeat protein [candidate division KSB3 bacterium]|uniref:Tetratricopeptide repeat protein n=1 Tax=candidate division KSB3 bacterium TaxID=2044937 RepID=A0A9D5Q7E8_9BACT|nr:tetratricopeptide repeat protein [candidate division KSB3 bacterium]MBD3326368.1 tetratricopeptide repeat protein [candidate division KSB3 bacterium]